MRILWLDTSPAPWKQADGWEFLKDYRLDFIRATNSADARAKLDAALPIAIAVINAETPGGLELVADIKGGVTAQRVPVILVSERWTKKEFKAHSASPHAADNYARLPMPASGFVDVVVGLTGVDSLERAFAEVAPAAPKAAADDPSALLLGGEAAPAAPARPKGAIQAFKEAITPWKKSEEAMELPASALTPAVGGRKAPSVEPLAAYGKADADVLRKYLALREQELARALRDKVSLEELHEKVSKEVEELRREMREIERMKAESDDKAERLEKRQQEHEKALHEQKDKAAFEQETLQSRISSLEAQLRDSKESYASLKDRVRRDIRKIQTREKELETRLELVKKDSETLIAERDRQVLELKRKIDALEFDLDLVQDRKVQAETNANKYVDKLSRVARTLHVAFGMLEEVEEEADENAVTKPILGGAAKTDESDLEKLLKTPAKELNSQELDEAEAPTRIFVKEADPDQLLAGAQGGEGAPGGEAGEGAALETVDDLDQALGS